MIRAVRATPPAEKIVRALKIHKLPNALILVGHMPDLEYLIKFWVGRTTEKAALAPGGTAKIKLMNLGEEGGNLEWILQPEDLNS